MTIGRNGSDRIVTTAATYTAKYRDGAGIVREIATGCRSKDGALSVLKELTDRAERVRSNILTVAEDRISDHQHTPLADHFAAFEQHLRAKGCTDTHRDSTLRYLRRLAEECRCSRLKDLTRDSLERWLSDRQAEGISAGARNGYREAWIGFVNWCVRTGRLLNNPLKSIPLADAKADCRRKRRSMTEAELMRLLDATHRRPLLDAMTIRRGSNKGKPIANVGDERRRKLERLGRERALIYKTYLLTGLRKSELASLTVASLELDGPMPYAVLNAAEEKNRHGSEIPLRADLVNDLREWLVDKLEAVRSEAMASNGQTVPLPEPPTELPADTPLFNVPAGLVRILDRDLKLAGITKRDERGRTVDIHGLRMTFGTLLSVGGVAPRTAQAAMRHSSIDLTMAVYTDPKLLDVYGAMNALPELLLDGKSTSERTSIKATGTDSCRPFPVAPTVVPNSGNLVPRLATADKTDNDCLNNEHAKSQPTIAVRAYVGYKNTPLSTADNGSSKSGRLDLNQRPLRPERSALPG